MNHRKRNLKVFLILAGLFVIASSPVQAACFGRLMNPLTDVCWDCVMPIKIGGVVVAPGTEPDTIDPDTSPVCACLDGDIVRPGVMMTMWQPANLIETVSTPFCFPTIGVGFPLPTGYQGLLSGSSEHNVSMGTHDTDRAGVFLQAHWFEFPVWSIMGVATDATCVETGTDISATYITELDPMWNNDMLALILSPEALLFANPVAQLSCMADAPLALAGGPAMSSSDLLFWCMGSWGTAYPMTGDVGNGNLVEGSAGVAARFLYKYMREGMVLDSAVDPCYSIPTPIWIKQDWKFQMAKPTRTIGCEPLGRTSLMWEAGMNPPMSAGGNKDDEFLWVLWNKLACCNM